MSVFSFLMKLPHPRTRSGNRSMFELDLCWMSDSSKQHTATGSKWVKSQTWLRPKRLYWVKCLLPSHGTDHIHRQASLTNTVQKNKNTPATTNTNGEKGKKCLWKHDLICNLGPISKLQFWTADHLDSTSERAPSGRYVTV